MLEKVKQKGRKSKKNSKATHKSLAHQAAEFQKREYLRNTGGLPGQPQPHDPMRSGDDSHYPDDETYDDDEYDEDGRPLVYDGEEYEPEDDQRYYEEDDELDDIPPLIEDHRPHVSHPLSMAPPGFARPSVSRQYEQRLS